MSHTCPRCGYDTERIGDMKKHLNRKTLCKPNEEDISLDEFKKLFFKEEKVKKEILYTCDNCNKGFISKRGHKDHVNKCTIKKTTLTVAGPSNINEVESLKAIIAEQKIFMDKQHALLMEAMKNNKEITPSIVENATINIENLILVAKMYHIFIKILNL